MVLEVVDIVFDVKSRKLLFTEGKSDVVKGKICGHNIVFGMQCRDDSLVSVGNEGYAQI